MNTKPINKKTAVLWTFWLTAIAAAAFFSMNAFTRPVFGNIRAWQLCFAALVLCLLVSAAVKRAPVSLGVCAAAAIAMYFVSPFFGALFFPVALQAALWEAARAPEKTGTAVFSLSLLLVPATVPLRLQAYQHLQNNLQSYTTKDPAGEPVACLAGLLLLLGVWIGLLIGSIRKNREAKKKPAKKRGRAVTDAGDARLPAVYAVCALHTVLAGAHCAQLFTGSFVKTLFFANAIFAAYLLYRRDALLCGALRLPAAEQQNE